MIDSQIAPSGSDQQFSLGPSQSKAEGSNVQPGTSLAWFRVEQLLAQDEIGQLCRGVDLVAEQDVMIRVLPRHFAQSSESAQRVKEYYRAVHSLHHQSICPVHCLGLEASAGYFLVMHCFAGTSLTEYCQSRVDKQRRMPFRDAIKLLAQCARALDYVHDRGVVHGDVRPQNILVDQQGNVRLTAIGLSQLNETAEFGPSDSANPSGSRQSFVAPECRRGERSVPKSDQYGLGVVAYELLTGELPTIDGCTMFAMVKPEHLPEHVVDAFTKALSGELAGRFENCTAFVQALIGEDTPSRKAMGALGANYLNELSKAKEVNGRPQSSQKAQVQSPAETEDDANRAPSDTDRSPARSRSSSDTKSADNVANSSGANSGRKSRATFAKFEPIRRTEAHRNGVTTVAFSRDGRFVLSGGKDKDVRVRDAKNARELRSLKGHSDRINSVAFCADGKRAVSCSDDATIRVWDTESGRQIRCLNGHRGGVKAVALAPDDKFVLSGGDDATVRLWDLETGDEMQQFGGIFSRHHGAIHGLAFANNGTSAVSGSLDGTVRLWNLATARQTARLLKQKDGVNCVCFSADNQMVAAGTQNGKIHVWEVENGTERFCLDGHQKPVWSVACSPLGGRLLSAGWDGAICLWDLDGGTQLNRFTGHTSGVNSLAFSPDGRTAISGGFDGNLQFWSL